MAGRCPKCGGKLDNNGCCKKCGICVVKKRWVTLVNPPEYII